jgi:hypothetical protein
MMKIELLGHCRDFAQMPGFRTKKPNIMSWAGKWWRAASFGAKTLNGLAFCHCDAIRIQASSSGI